MFRLFSFCRIRRDARKADESKEIERRDARMAAQRFSRGNIPLQHGAFVGPEDLEAERKQSQFSFRR